MSDSRECSQITAGMFSLPLSINQQFFDRDLASTYIRQHEAYLRENKDRPHRFAIRNFLAVFHFRLGNIFDACDYFKGTLSEDESNLNALTDLAYVYQKLYQHTKAEKLLEKRNSLVEVKENADNLERKRQSRCIAETGYMYANDLSRGTISTEKHQQACDMYSEAIRLSGGIVVEEELQDWKFYRGLLYRNMYNIHLDFDTGNNATVKEFYDKAEDDLRGNLTASNIHRQADASSILGSLMAKRCSRGMCPREMNECHDMEIKDKCPNKNKNEKYQSKKGKCQQCRKKINNLYKKALRIDPKNIRTHIRYGRELEHSRDFEGALYRFTHAIMLDESSTNWLAYSSRAGVYINKYNRSKYKDRCYLILAETDLLKSITGNTSPIDLARLGHVYHLLGSTAAKSRATGPDGASGSNVAVDVEDDKQYLLKALHYFMKATEIVDGNLRSDIHYKRGKCLLDINEQRGAVESFKQALECEQSNCNTLKNVGSLILTLFDMFKMIEDGNHKEILAELCFWWRSGFLNKRVEFFVNKKKNVNKMLELLRAVLEYENSDQDKFVTTSLIRILNENENKRIKEKLNILLSQYTQNEGPNETSATISSAITPETKGSQEEGNTCSVRHDNQENVQIGQVPPKLKEETNRSRSDQEPVWTFVDETKTSSNVANDVVTSFDDAATSATLAAAVDDGDAASTIHDTIFTNRTVTTAVDIDVSSISSSATNAATDPASICFNNIVASTADDAFTSVTSTAAATTTTTKETLKRSESHTLLTIGSDGICISKVEDHPSKSRFSTEQTQCSIADVVLYICKQLDVQNRNEGSRSTIPHSPSTSKSGFTYDFFVVFSKKQEAWVYYTLLARLEQSYRLKGCIPARDFLPGETVCKNIETCVEESACTLVVIDKGFCEDHELRHRLTYAYYTNTRLKKLLIPILKERCEVPMVICNLTPLIVTKSIDLSKLARDIEIASLKDRHVER